MTIQPPPGGRSHALPASLSLVAYRYEHHSPAAEADLRVALIGTFAPRKCGIATFTTDIVEQLAAHRTDIAVDVYALAQPGPQLSDPRVAAVIDASDPESYRRAVQRINRSGADCVWIQHEFGIFGPGDGKAVCDFADELSLPLIVTFHTVLTNPSLRQRAIIEHLQARAARIMVMSQEGRRLLIENYGADDRAIEVIAHGAPDRPFGRQDLLKPQLGQAGRDVLMTFGLLGPGKGLERAIEAMPAIVQRHPQVLYRIVGATHPNLVASEGEAYRHGLQDLARRLGIENHIEWDDRFLETAELLDQLEACDIYLTPYPNLQQSTSGTLSYAVALGKAVVSTPYIHARELLADGVGVLVEPDSSDALAEAIIALLDDREELRAVQRRAYAVGRTTIWPEFARATAALVRQAVGQPSGTVSMRGAMMPSTRAPQLAAIAGPRLTRMA